MNQEVQGIGWAVKQLQDGKKVRRLGWNGRNMFLVYVPGTTGDGIPLKEGTPYAKALAGRRADELVRIESHIDMYTALGTFQPGWLASQADLLATDWVLAE